tara:strand:+ start:11922 stop:12728 length:807 start_codon:yes stop_codon:yes gene_type:complete
MKKLALTLLLLSSLTSCGEIIDSGHRGVKVKLGKVSDNVLTEGFYFYFPLTTSIMEIDARIQKLEMKSQTYTRDIQTANIKYVINGSIDGTKVNELYRDVGVGSKGIGDSNFRDKIIVPIIEGEMKSVVGLWTATDLIANREKATDQIFERIKSKLALKNVILTNFQIIDIDYADAFEKAVENKVVAIQRAEEAKNNTAKIREEAKQRIISAEAEAKSMRIRANALSANKDLIEYERVQVEREAITKWNGTLPHTMLGNSTPFIKLGN